jgi:prepilin peptidase CpaA
MTSFQSELTYPVAASVCAIVGAIYDVKSRRIPNLLTGPSIILGLSMHLALGGWRQMLCSLAAGLVCGLVFLLFYLAGGMGAGDVKLMMAVGCIVGWSHLDFVYALALTAICGGVMAVSLALYRGRLRETILNMGELISHHKQEGLHPHPDLNIANVQTLRLPYALAIAGGCLLTLFLSYRGAV